MIQLISKKDQVVTTLFGGNFVTNKPVAKGNKVAATPYSNLFYWSHARALESVEFGLHPHNGFEIMTFIWEGENVHYDTSSTQWTPLAAGQFQIIKSGKGLQHAERISPGTRAFQIWFDPDFTTSLHQTPAYTDYNRNDWSTVIEDGFTVHYYLGGNSPAQADTEGVVIKTYTSTNEHTQTIKLQADINYHVYLLKGTAQIGNIEAQEDDGVKVTRLTEVKINLKANSVLFVIQTQMKPSYKTVLS